jgi:hypothetical protein
MGLIANGTIERGDLLKAHAGAAIFHNDCVDKSFDDYLPHKEGLMKLAVNQLPPPTRDLFLAMAAHNESEEPYIEKIYTNTFGEDFGNEEHSLVVPETAKINHNCRPNAMYYFDWNTLVHYTHASGRIYAGEEITITYIDPLQTRLRRRAAIKSSWGFDCSCSLCSAENHFIRESDRRVIEINRISKILDEVVSQNETEREAARKHVSAAAEMADLLVSLYEQERQSALSISREVGICQSWKSTASSEDVAVKDSKAGEDFCCGIVLALFIQGACCLSGGVWRTRQTARNAWKKRRGALGWVLLQRKDRKSSQ